MMRGDPPRAPRGHAAEANRVAVEHYLRPQVPTTTAAWRRSPTRVTRRKPPGVIFSYPCWFGCQPKPPRIPS